MVLIRLFFLMALGLLLAFAIPKTDGRWTHSTTSHSKHSLSWHGDKPSAYQLLIRYDDNKHNHTNIVNQGTARIVIDVKANEEVLRGGITQINADYTCKVRSETGFLHGSFNVHKTTTINTDKPNDYMIEKSRKDINQYLQEQILKP